MSDEIESEAERLVEEAIDAGILRQSGPHFYAVAEEGEGDHIGQGHEAAVAWLEEEGYVEEVPEESSAPEPNASGEEEGSVETGEAGEAEAVKTDSHYNTDGIYRHEGEEMQTFSRPGRADGMLFPGGTYQNLPLGNDDIQRLIDEGVLVDISS